MSLHFYLDGVYTTVYTLEMPQNDDQKDTAQKIIGDLGTVTKYEIKNRAHLITVYTLTDGTSCDTQSLWPVTGVGRDLQEAVDDVRAQIKHKSRGAA